MTDRELQLIMGALENHREDVKSDLREIKASIAEQRVIVQAHQDRFHTFDTVVSISKKVGAGIAAIGGAAWAVFTYFSGGK